MEFLSREQIINELQQSFQPYIEKFDLDGIGIFEEEGKDNRYYLGYTAEKDGKTYHVHIPYIKNNSGALAPVETEWTVESDDPRDEDRRGYNDVESIFRTL
ncbi:DUF5634 family protein [Lederbergia citrea]|uniref:DUF5634 family protein n=1 Tax=Lederbergia citrea TaxID=2833581 RepID=UPI001BC8E2B2|nr:DUF5634 family protein [Lederbergia citrea]MBS4177747.1 DUF5634 family protein [Lederbergia citrea]MBS4204420.1 DUF5634 family protein [Lederbergia citrea]